MEYYREKATGDYLVIDPDTLPYYRKNFGKNEYEGKATAIAKEINSVCTTAISHAFLMENCVRIGKSEVPQQWLKQF
jgi:hypothetical protein